MMTNTELANKLKDIAKNYNPQLVFHKSLLHYLL